VGLVQRAVEAAGFSTITLSNIPDLTAAVGVPRLAAIGYPPGVPLGAPGDAEGQTAVLRAVLQALVDIPAPGGVVHLPFMWSPGGHVRTLPPRAPPIVQYLFRRPWLYPRLLRREIPGT
jgi:hypothetical protein